MGRLKPIGSEKLQGDDKVKRIMEIARFGETNKNEDLHVETNHFTKKGADGRTYSIVLERDGYYLKSGINESELDYLSGAMNKKRDRFKSYGSALKRMNLIFKPLNEEYNDGKAISMYEPSEEMEEQEKFVLNVPDEEGGEEDIDMGMDTEAGEDDLDMDLDMDMGDEEEDIDVDVEGEGGEEEMEGFMKPIQKLTGKLGQKLRDVEEELGSADIKYVLNSVISAVNLDNLDEDDMDDILDRFDDDETSYGDEEEMDVDIDMGDEDMDLDTEDDVDMDLDMDMDDEEVAMESIKENIGNGNGQNFGLMGTPTAKYKDLLEKEDIEEDDVEEGEDEEVKEMETPAIEDVEEGVAVESLKERVGNLLESYVTKKTKKVKSVTPQDYLNSRLEKIKESKKIKKNYNTIEQELSCEKFLKENNSFKFKRKTETGKIILESKDRKVWILNNGTIK